MAQIDPNIALGFRLPQIQDPLASTARAQEIGVNALKMQELQRGVEQENKLRELIAGGADLNAPETIRQMYGISPKMGAEFEKSRAALRKEQTIVDKNVADLEATYMKNARDTLSAVGDQNSYSAWREQTIKRLPGLANMIPPQYSPQAKTALMADANKYLDQTQITAAQQAQMGVTMRGQDIGAQTTMRGQDIGRIPVGYRMTPEGTIEAIPGGPTTTPISPKEMQVREAKFPQATSALKSFDAKSDELIRDIQRLRNHPGLNSITGIVYGRTPSVTKEGREAQALYDKVTAGLQFKELQDMRNASPTGGALGNVSNQEGQFLRQAAGALDRTQEPGSVQAELDRIANSVSGSKQRLREAYDMTYDYKGLGGGATAPSAAPATPSAPSAGGNTVAIPGGKVLTFPTPEAAAAYKKAAGL
jgi:hypothetical protein